MIEWLSQRASEQKKCKLSFIAAIQWISIKKIHGQEKININNY